MKADLGPGDFVFHGKPAPHRKKAQPHPIIGPCLLWPNDCVYQDTTWYSGRHRPRPHCVRWGPNSPSPKGTQPPIFAQCFVAKRLDGLRCHMVGLGPDDFVFDGDPATQLKRHSPHTKFLAHVYCGQTALCIKMPLGTEVNLGPGDVLGGSQLRPP